MSPPLRRVGCVLAVLLPVLIGAALRLSTSGGPPFTDGGTYQYGTWLARELGGSFPVAPLNFYAWCASFVGADPDTPFYRVRVFDACVGALAAGLFAHLLRRFVGSLWACVLASVWAVCAATPLVNDAGYKNPISAAWCALFLALAFATRRRRRRGGGGGGGGRAGSMRAGALTVLACFFREAFAPALVFVPVIVAVHRGRSAALRACVGIALGLLCGLLWMLAVDIDPFVALDYLRAASRNAAELLRTTGQDPAEIRSRYFGWIVDWFGFLAAPLCLGVVTLPCWWRRPGKRVGFAVVWALVLMPLPEIYGKFCLPYHWFQITPALILFGGLGARHLGAKFRARLSSPGQRAVAELAVVAAVLTVCWFAGGRTRQGFVDGQYLSNMYAPVMVDGDWAHPVTEQSRYLSMAAWLRSETAADARIMVSGYAYGVYLLAGRSPANVEVSDLSFGRLTGQAAAHPEWFERLRQDPPDVVIETQRWPEPLDGIWPDFESRYELAREWPKEPGLHYGNFAARAWRLK